MCSVSIRPTRIHIMKPLHNHLRELKYRFFYIIVSFILAMTVSWVYRYNLVHFYMPRWRTFQGLTPSYFRPGSLLGQHTQGYFFDNAPTNSSMRCPNFPRDPECSARSASRSISPQLSSSSPRKRACSLLLIAQSKQINTGKIHHLYVRFLVFFFFSLLSRSFWIIKIYYLSNHNQYQ